MGRDRSGYRPPQDRRDMPRWFRRAVDAMENSRPRQAKDAFYTLLAAGIEPFPVTDAKLLRAEQFLGERGLTSNHVRALGWRRSLDALDECARTRAGLAVKLRRPAGKRTLNAPAGTFPQLEDDLAAIEVDASRPRTTICDSHDPVDAGYCRAQARRVLIMATRLFKVDRIGTDVRLSTLTAIELQQAHLELVDEQDRAGNQITWLSDYLSAVRLFAARVHGPGSDEAAFALAQQQARGASSEMTEQRIRMLLNLLSAEKLRAVRQAPDGLIAQAERALILRTPRWRQSVAKKANLAAGLALQTELLLKSHQLATLEFDPDGMPRLPHYDPKTLGSLPLSARTLGVLARRRDILAQLEMRTVVLFPGKNGAPATEQSVVISVGHALREGTLAGVTLQCLRDLGAVLLLRENPRSIRRVATLLGMKSITAVRRRYHPFLRAPTS